MEITRRSRFAPRAQGLGSCAALVLASFIAAGCGNGARGDAGDAGADGTVNPGACTNDTECGRGLLCDRAHGVCAQCVTNDDCTGGRVCNSGTCEVGTMCTSSRQCPGQVCSTTTSVCVDCNASNDCPAEQMCRGGTCVDPPPSCTSSRQCSALGQVCDTTRSICVDCVGDNDCGPGRLCAADSVCRVPLCTPNAMECVSPAMAQRCNARGSAWEQQACTAAQTCSEGACRERVCTPSSATCMGLGARTVCNADGLGTSVVPCAASESCSAGVCVPRVCTPGTNDCNAGMVRTCNPDGLGYTMGTCGGANATGMCSMGACVLTCSPGFSDCDRSVINGCEVSTTSDSMNCGACGTVCPAGQSCSAGRCTAGNPVDVMILLDTTGSIASSFSNARTALQESLARPLLDISDVNVGVAYTCEFSTNPYGNAGDVPFTAVQEPTRELSQVITAIGAARPMGGGDADDAMVEAIGTLAGLPLNPQSRMPTPCSSGRLTSGCWRPGARRVIVLFSDSTFHNGPTTAGALRSPYMGITPAPHEWPSVVTTMQASNSVLLMMSALSGTSGGRDQWARMLTDLGQPATDLLETSQGSTTAVAAGSVVARVRALRGM